MKKLLPVLLVLLVMASCSTTKNISYFQDANEPDSTVSVPSPEIRLRPEDKISIIVNCNDIELTNLFNLPYISQRIGQTTEASNTSNGIAGYIVDKNGNIDFPVIGSIHIAGLTRDEVAALVKSELVSRDLAKDPVVTVEYMNLRIDVMGEVTKPGSYTITRDKVTILDAISMAGDLTILGRRDNVRVLRADSTGTLYTYPVDLRSLENVKSSPVYYLHQNDVVYVEPNPKKARESTVNGNSVMQASFWISVCSLLASVASTVTLIMTRVQ